MERPNTTNTSDEAQEKELARLLSHHYGDGVVYIRFDDQNKLYELAIEKGYISREGYLTKNGRLLIARYARN